MINLCAYEGIHLKSKGATVPTHKYAEGNLNMSRPCPVSKKVQTTQHVLTTILLTLTHHYSKNT